MSYCCDIELTPSSADSQEDQQSPAKIVNIHAVEVDETEKAKVSLGVVSSDEAVVVDGKALEDLSNDFHKKLTKKVRISQSFDHQVRSAEGVSKSTSVAESAPFVKPTLANGVNSAGFDLLQIKDEHGQTVLHLAASRPQRVNIFVKLMLLCVKH